MSARLVLAAALALLAACARPVGGGDPGMQRAADAGAPASESPVAPPAPATPVPEGRSPLPAAAPPAAQGTPPAAVVSPAPVVQPAPAPPAVALSPRERVEVHLEQVWTLAARLQKVVDEPCPRFATRQEWDRYLDAQVGDVVLLAAHAREASSVARRSRDQELIQAAEAPKERVDEAHGLLEKLEACARDNGTSLDVLALARRVRRETPKRRAEIRLSTPKDPAPRPFELPPGPGAPARPEVKPQ